MIKKRIIALVFIVSTVRICLGLKVLLAERFALWNKGLVVTLPRGDLLLTNHSTYASQLIFHRASLRSEAKDF